ncbi:GAF domain-containing protein [Nocardia sp. NPDC004068]|uniref:GAF domain-containing protein n=1 Tax=Nocardia sp. NPDC004068 TaxID=3364303 RepID=UPI0036755BCF
MTCVQEKRIIGCMAEKIVRQEERARSPQWLLVETFGELDGNYSIVDWGGQPKEFLPLDKAVKGAAARIRQAVTTVAHSHEPLSAKDDGGHRVEAYPHFVGERLHAVQVWSGTEDQQPPPRLRAASWDIDLTTLTALGSTEWAELADIPLDERGQERSLANMFAQVQTDERELQAMKRIIAAVPGTTHQGVWTVYRRDGASFRAHFSCRIYAQPGADGTEHRVARGVSLEITSSTTDTKPQPLVLLEHRLLEADVPPGEYRALINLRNLRLIRWVHGSPIPDQIAWRRVENEPEPGVHPDDRRTMIDMAKGLARSSTTGHLRVRGVHGGWIPITARVSLVAIDQETTAGLVKFTIDH